MSSLPASRVQPLAPGRYGIQFTIAQEDHERLEQAKNMLAHIVPSGDTGEIFVRALRVLVRQLEKRKFGKTDRPRNMAPRQGAHEDKNPRHIPARVRRAVHERDRGRCTFVGENGRRCEARRGLEFDHIEPIARGGRSTASNLRLRCRAHNQLEAERTFGADLMKGRREEAAARKRTEEIVPWLQALGIRADHALQAAARCESMPNASLEDRVKAALRHFGPRDVCLRHAMPASALPSG